MRCALTFEKIVRHGGKHLDIWRGTTSYPSHTWTTSTTRLAASSIYLPAGTYTLSADAEGVTCKIYTYIDGQAAGIFPASGEGELPFTFTLPEMREIAVNFAFEGWDDTEITPDDVQNAMICEGDTPITADVWDTIALSPSEISDNAAIAQAVNSKSSVTLRVLPSFELWQFCEKSVTYVRIMDLDRTGNRLIFRGRVSAITDGMDESGLIYQDITLVSALDFLEDTPFFVDDCTGYLVNPSDPTNGLISDSIVRRHNSAVGNDTFRHFLCSVTGNAWYTKDSTVYGSRYAVLSTMMTDGNLRKYSGGVTSSRAYTMEYRESFAGDANTLEIAERFGQTVDTAILIGDNLRSIKVDKALQDAVYTKVRAISGVNSDGSREYYTATNTKMYAQYGGGRTLTQVNDSIKCTAPMYEETQYGTHTTTAAHDAMLAALRECAEEEAEKLSDIPIKMTISAADLADMGFSGYEPFEVGNSYPVVCPPLGLYGKPMRITALKRRLCDGRIEQIVIETGKKVVHSSATLSAMLARLEELNQQISDSSAEQVEIAQTIAEKVVEEQTDGVKIRLSHPQGYGEVQHLNIVTDESGRTDLYADNYLIGGSGGYSIMGLTKSAYDALTTYSDTTIYIVDNSGTTEMYVGDQLITQKGGGGETIETATVLSSEQMSTWAPEHELVPVEFRGSAAVYYAQAPARLVIQGQLALFGMTDSQMTANDIMSELTYEFRDGSRQKLKAFVRSMTETSVSISAALYDVSGAAETLIGYQNGSYTRALPSGWRSLKIGFAVHVSQYYLNNLQQIAPDFTVKMYVFVDGVMSGSGTTIPAIDGTKFPGYGLAPTTDFGSDAERGFASGISRRTEPSYGDDSEEEEEASEE